MDDNTLELIKTLVERISQLQERVAALEAQPQTPPIIIEREKPTRPITPWRPYPYPWWPVYSNHTWTNTSSPDKTVSTFGNLENSC